MAVQDYFEFAIAYNPDTEVLQKSASFQVFAVDDLAFATPLTVFDHASGAVLSPLMSTDDAIVPAFRVQGDPTQVILKSGSWVTRLTSRYGILREAGFDVDVIQGWVTSAQAAATNAQASATASAASATAAAASAAAAAASAAEAAGGSDPAELPYWGLPVWRDEFTAGLAKWNVRNNFTTIDTARAMTPNVTVESGVAHLKGIWLTTPEAAGPQGIITHTTGYIDTRNLTDTANPTPKHFSQQYGRWEIRCKVPTGANTRGALAAFWLRCDSHPGEIDIMEAWGGGGTMAADWTTYVKDTAWTTFHSSTSSATVNGKPYTKTFWRHYQHGVPKPMWDAMHTYAFERTPTYMKMFVDDIQVFHITPTTADPQNSGQTLAWLWDSDFFGSPLHMRLNLHVGPSPTYWGIPDVNNRSTTVDPLDFEIEYVRVYAMP